MNVAATSSDCGFVTFSLLADGQNMMPAAFLFPTMGFVELQTASGSVRLSDNGRQGGMLSRLRSKRVSMSPPQNSCHVGLRRRRHRQPTATMGWSVASLVAFGFRDLTKGAAVAQVQGSPALRSRVLRRMFGLSKEEGNHECDAKASGRGLPDQRR